MKKESKTLSHAMWMLANAIQNISSAQRAFENDQNKFAIEWLTEAVDSIARAEKALDDTNLLPF